LSILIVDDDEDLRLLARKALERADYRVLEARDGIEGLEMAAKCQPDLLLLDLNMPGMDGLEVLRRLRESETSQALPVLVLTAQGDEEGIRRSFATGATDFLAKPFTAGLEARVRSNVARVKDVP
jgi:DNA-binding response OmpR family regulator